MGILMNEEHFGSIMLNFSRKYFRSVMENKQLPHWLGVGVTFAVALAATTAILSLRHWSNYVSELTLPITEFQLHVSRLDRLRLRAIKSGKIDSTFKKEAKQTKSQANILLRQLSENHQDHHIKEIHDIYHKYIRVLDQELQLIEQGNIDRAQIADRQIVDPISATLDDLLRECNQKSTYIGNRANRQADVGTILTILAAAVAISLALKKIAQANQLTEIALAQQHILEASETLLKEERALLAAKVIERTQEIDNQNQILSQTLKQLQSAQTELIESEKMVALGHLVAGIAHEINTPLGAIQASTGNLTKALQEALAELPSLVRRLTIEQQQDFFALLDRVLHSRAAVTSSEKRPLKRALTKELEVYGFENARQIADRLVDLGIQADIKPFVSLLQSDQGRWVLELVYNLSRIQGNNQTIQTAVDRAAKIVFALKSYARFDQSGEQQVVKIAEGLETVLELYHNKMKHGVEVVRKYTPIPEFWGYPDELIQVWTNLIHNAIQAMEGGGILEILTMTEATGGDVGGAFPVENRASGGSKWAIIQIIDSGSGIAAGTQAKIFDPFFTTKPAGEGSGLGLSISQTIVEKHGGKIELDSRPGRTIFTVSIPLTDDKLISTAKDSQPKSLTFDTIEETSQTTTELSKSFLTASRILPALIH
jgi:signal transduction histidine kinase